MHDKLCPRCKIRKGIFCFYKSSRTADGISRYCKACDKMATQRYQERHPAMVVETRKKYRAKHRIYTIWSTAKRRAQKANLPFNLEISDIVIPEFCPYLGLKIAPYGSRTDMSASLDKIIPNLGYVKGNVQVISDLANKMKSNATPAQLAAFARVVLKL